LEENLNEKNEAALTGHIIASCKVTDASWLKYFSVKNTFPHAHTHTCTSHF